MADYEKIWPSHLGRLRQYLVESPWPNTVTLGRVPLAEYENTLAEYPWPNTRILWPSTLGRIREYFGRVPLAEYSNTWPLRSDNLITNRPHLVRGASDAPSSLYLVRPDCLILFCNLTGSFQALIRTKYGVYRYFWNKKIYNFPKEVES